MAWSNSARCSWSWARRRSNVRQLARRVVRRPSAQSSYRSSGSRSPLYASRAACEAAGSGDRHACRRAASKPSTSTRTSSDKPREITSPSRVRNAPGAAPATWRPCRAWCSATRRLLAAAGGSSAGQSASISCSRWMRWVDSSARSLTTAAARFCRQTASRTPWSPTATWNPPRRRTASARGASNGLLPATRRHVRILVAESLRDRYPQRRTATSAASSACPARSGRGAVGLMPN